ncbi:MAG: trypsin-like peptidase domain-containing protein [Nannocystaceae bacterium]
MRVSSHRRNRLRSPRALALFFALSGAGAVAMVVPNEGHATAPQALWSDGAGQTSADTDAYAPRRSLAPLIESISPAVVSVRTKGKRPQAGAGVDPRMLPFLPQMPQQQPAEGIGSGFIIRADGLVVTNHHVVDGSDTVEVKLADGRLFAAEVLGSDPHTDVAVVKLKGKGVKDLPTVKLGSSDALAVGDWVLAIGSPMGLEKTATTGILSAKKRGSLGLYSNSYVDFLQTDAAISPGNSGGPLFNLQGEVVGINTAISAMGRGIGFAVPIDQAKGVIPQLYAGGKVERAWLGITGRDIEPAVGQAPVPGAIIGEIHPGTPAARAGLQTGDRIVAVDGKAIENFSDLRGRVAELTPDTKVTMSVARGGKGKTVDVAVKLGKLPTEDELRRLSAAPSAGGPASNGDLFGGGKPQLGVEVDPKAATQIRRVRPGSLGADLGLRPGDTIQEINGEAIRDRDDIGRALAKDRRRVEVTVNRNGSTHTSVIQRR